MEQSAFTQSPGLFTAQVISSVAFCILLLAGVLKCVVILGKKRHNAKCVLSLIFTLSAVSIFYVVSALYNLAGLNRIILVVLALPCLGLVVAGMILAILGLVELAQGTGRGHRGRFQAITTLVLSGIAMIMFMVGAIQGARNARNALLLAGTEAPGAKLTFDELNFEMEVPSEPWARFDAKKINEAATLGFLRSDPEVYFMVIAEQIGNSALDSEALAELVQARWRTVGKTGKMTKEEAQLEGIPGFHLSCDVQIGINRLCFVSWAGAHNGYTYQIVSYGDNTNAPTIRRANEELRGLFKLIDPERIAQTPGATPLDDYRSEPYGYSVSLKDSPWFSWDTLADDMPQADFGAQAAPERALAVIPYFLMEHTASPDDIAQTLLSVFDIDFRKTSFAVRESFSNASGEGLLLHHARMIDSDEFCYVFRTLRRGSFAYLIAAWQVVPSEPAVYESLEKELERVRIDDKPPEPFDMAALPETERHRHALFLNDLAGCRYAAKEYEAARDIYKSAYALEPDSVVMLTNALDAYIALDQYQEGLEYIEKKGAARQSDPEVQSYRAFLLSRLGNVEGALAAYESLFGQGKAAADDLDAYVQLLRDRGEHEKALEAVTSYAKDPECPEMVVLKADIYVDMDRDDEAVALIKKKQEQLPANSDLGYALAETCLRSEQHLDCRAACEDLIKRGFDGAYTYYLKGRAELALDWYKEAKASFEAANKKEPADEDYTRYLEYVSGLLGEGANTAIKEPIERVPVPESLLSSLPSDMTGPYCEKANACEMLHLTAMQFKNETPFKTTVLRRIKVLDPTGVEQYSSFQVPFDPLHEKAYVNALRVLDENGAVLSEGQISDYYVVDDTSDGMATQDKLVSIPVPGLKPGCSIELDYTIQDFADAKRSPFQQVVFCPSIPTFRRLVYVAGDVESVRHVSPPGMEPTKLDGALLWKVERPVVYKWEPRCVPVQEYAPVLTLGPAGTNWASEVAMYLDEIAAPLEQDPAVSALAKSLVDGIENPKDRILALARHVRTNFTYKAIEFGRRAHVPNTVAQITRNQYGDCKDLALLLHHLLRAIEVPSCLALVNMEGPVQEDLASIDQFNHMVLFTPALEGGRFIDCCDKDAEMTLPIPMGLGGRQALLLDSEAPRIEKIPAYPADSSLIRCERQVHWADVPTAEVEETIEYRGYYASLLRGYLRGIDAPYRSGQLQRLLAPYAEGIRVSALETEHLDEPDVPLVLRVSYSFQGNFQGAESRTLTAFPALWECWHLSEDFVPARTTPFELEYPLTIESTAVLIPPAGYAAREFEATHKNHSSEFFAWSLDLSQEAANLRAAYQMRRPACRHEATKYETFVADSEDARKAFNVNVAFDKQTLGQ